MAFSKDEIDKIHQQATATFNREYASLDGTVYVGLRNGRLKLRDSAITDLQSQVDNITEAPDSIEDELDEALSKAKCFNIAMAVSL